jgi:GNAT superfamily N-acetyltransferase
MTVRIVAAETASDYAVLGELMREYVGWCRERYAEDAWFVDQALSHQSLDSELADLAAKYGPPAGRAFLAYDDGEALGCGAYRRHRDGCSEMKRLFVPARHQGRGIGRRLCAAIVAAARDDGYSLMRLDTANRLTEAIALYRSFGFSDCAPYNSYPQRLMSYILFMELPLAPDGAGKNDKTGTA